MSFRFAPLYYQKINKQYGYSNKWNFDFGPLKPIKQYLINSSVSAFNFKKFCKNLTLGKRSLVTNGFGLTAKPHIGSLIEILKMVRINNLGINTQIVLGDIDAYNFRNADLDKILHLLDSWRKFILRLGYNLKNGIIRSQYKARDVMLTHLLISQQIKDEDFIDMEEDTAFLYKQRGIYNGLNYPQKVSINLMIADFLDPGLNKGIKNILVLSGFEEHKYLFFADKVKKKIGLNLNLSGLFGKMIKGKNNFPRMCKSIPETAIYVDSDEKVFKEYIFFNCKNNKLQKSWEENIFNLYISLIILSLEETNELKQVMLKDKRKWLVCKERLLDFLKNISLLWKKSESSRS